MLNYVSYTGQSGGPILTETGTLLGICVCNAKDGQNIYPMINMCIPIYDIYHILENFSRSNGKLPYSIKFKNN